MTLLAVSLATMAAFYARRIPAEERMLEGHFGDAWRLYRTRVRGGLVPRLQRRLWGA